MTSAAETPVRAYREGLTERTLARLTQLAREIPADASPSDVGMMIGEAYVELFDAWYCRFWWVDDAREVARVIAHYPAREFKESWEHEKRLDVTEGDDKSLVALVIGSGEARIERDAAEIKDGEIRFATVYGVQSGCHFPLIVQGTTMGDMVMTSQEERQHFDPADRDLIQVMANFAASAIALAQARS